MIVLKLVELDLIERRYAAQEAREPGGYGLRALLLQVVASHKILHVLLNDLDIQCGHCRDRIAATLGERP